MLSAMTLCLAKPRWVWHREVDDQNLSGDEESTKKLQNDEEYWMKALKKEQKRMRPTCQKGNCVPW